MVGILAKFQHSCKMTLPFAFLTYYGRPGKQLRPAAAHQEVVVEAHLFCGWRRFPSRVASVDGWDFFPVGSRAGLLGAETRKIRPLRHGKCGPERHGCRSLVCYCFKYTFLYVSPSVLEAEVLARVRREIKQCPEPDVFRVQQTQRTKMLSETLFCSFRIVVLASTVSCLMEILV